MQRYAVFGKQLRVPVDAFGFMLGWNFLLRAVGLLTLTLTLRTLQSTNTSKTILIPGRDCAVKLLVRCTIYGENTMFRLDRLSSSSFCYSRAIRNSIEKELARYTRKLFSLFH